MIIRSSDHLDHDDNIGKHSEAATSEQLCCLAMLIGSLASTWTPGPDHGHDDYHDAMIISLSEYA